MNKDKLYLVVEVGKIPENPDSIQLVAREIEDLRKKINIDLTIVHMFTSDKLTQ